jgi:hypothetical protein
LKAAGKRKVKAMEATTSLVTTPDRDATLGELMADPLTHALMKADHVDVGSFERMLQSLAGRLQAAGLTPQSIVGAKAAAAGWFERSIVEYGPWAPEECEGIAAAWLPHGPLAAKAADIACGSPCAW